MEPQDSNERDRYQDWLEQGHTGTFEDYCEWAWDASLS